MKRKPLKVAHIFRRPFFKIKNEIFKWQLQKWTAQRLGHIPNYRAGKKLKNKSKSHISQFTMPNAVWKNLEITTKKHTH